MLIYAFAMLLQPQDVAIDPAELALQEQARKAADETAMLVMTGKLASIWPSVANGKLSITVCQHLVFEGPSIVDTSDYVARLGEILLLSDEEMSALEHDCDVYRSGVEDQKLKRAVRQEQLAPVP